MESEGPRRQQQFIAGILAGLRYFQELVAQGDEAFTKLEAERQNLHRIVQYGLAFPEAWSDAAAVIDQTFPLVERRGYWPEWIPTVCYALTQCPIELLRQKIVLGNRLGLLYRLDRQLFNAITVHQDTEEIAVKLGDEILVAQTQYYLLGDYFANRQYVQAEQIGLVALSTIETHQAESKSHAAILQMLGNTAHERSDLELARRRLEEAVAIWRIVNEPTELARSLNDLANIYLVLEKFDQALSCYKEAVNILQSSISELDKVLIFINLGALYFRQGRLLEAESAFREADSDYLRRSMHYYYQASVANGLGNVLLEQRRLAEATLYLKEAIRLWHLVDDPVYLANTLGSLGEVSALQRQTAVALSLYKEAITLLERYSDGDWAKRILKGIKVKQKELLDEEE